MKTYWRPSMAWLYILICAADFIIFPSALMTIQYYTQGDLTQWVPLTLGSGGFFHIAMGAVLGITAYGRSREKMVSMESGYFPDSTTSFDSETVTLDPTFGGEASDNTSNETNKQ